MDEQTGSQRTSVWTKAEGELFTAEQSHVLQDQALWTAFAEATTVQSFCQHCLALQCRMMGGVRAGMVLIGPADRGPFRPVAVWPDGRQSPKHLSTTAEKTLADRRGLVSRGSSANGDTSDGHYEIGYPIEARGALHGATVLEVLPSSDAALQGLMRQLHWGAAWLELLFSRESAV